MNITQKLRSINPYPIPMAAVEAICLDAGIEGNEEATAEIVTTTKYRRAKAYVYSWLADAPNVTQGGINYNFSDAQRALFKKKAAAILEEIGDDTTEVGDQYGYIGEDF